MSTMDKGELQEAVVTLYLRLNGYFTSGFIVPSPTHGRIKTELDVLAVRFPANAQPERTIGVDPNLATSDERVDFIIGEVKSVGEPLQFNQPLRSSPDSVFKILRWWGYFSKDECRDLVDGVTGLLAPSPGAATPPTLDCPRNARVRALLFSPERTTRSPNQAWFIPGPLMFEYVRRCLHSTGHRPESATTYDFGRWGRELEPIVRYFKEGAPDTGGDLKQLLKHLNEKAR